ncbi:TPA: phage baseplate protein [Escherichia coli]
MAANTPQQAAQAVKKADNGKYDYANMKSQNKNIQAVHNAKNDELKSERVKEIEKERKETQEYTIIVSGFNYGGNSNLLQQANADHIVLMFDAVPQYSYTRAVEKTSYAVENRTDFSDHGVIKDGTFSFKAFVTSSPTYIRRGNRLDQDTDPDNPAASRRPAVALQFLERLVDDRVLINLATEERMLENYIITRLSVNRDVSEGAALVVDVELTEFRTFELYATRNATIHSDPKKTGTKNKGAVQSSSKNAADSDKLKNEQTAVKKTEGLATGGTRVDTPNGSTWYDEDGNYIGHKGGWYKPNVGLEINK